MLTVLVISGVEITPWSTLLKEIWRVGCRGADKYLDRPRKNKLRLSKLKCAEG